jgi:hypothetical protein
MMDKKEAQARLEEIIKEITTRLDPIITMGRFAFVVCLPGEEDQGDYAIFGNLPDEMNRALIRTVAIDMAFKDLNEKIDQAKAMAERKELGASVN